MAEERTRLPEPRLGWGFWSERIPAEFVLGAVAGVFAIAGVLSVASAGGDPALVELAFELFVNVGMPLVVVTGAAWLRLSELPRSTWWSVVGGYAGGIAFIGVLVVWSNLPALLEGGSLLSLREDFVFFGNLGGVFGFFAGVSRARSRHSRRLRRDLETRSELVESAEEALWMFTADFSEVLYMNSAYEDIFGQSLERLEANPTAFLETIHPDDRDHVRDAIDRLSDGESIEIEYRITDDGETCWVSVNGQPVYREDELYAVAGFVRDITVRKRRELRFEAVFNQTYQFTGLMEPDGTLIEANETALSFVGADRETVTDRPLWETPWFQYDDETREIARESVEQGRNGEFYRGELPIEGADGQTITVDYSVRPVTDEDGAVSLLVPEGRDITARKRYEEQVVSLHETTRRLFQADTATEAAEIATETAGDVLGLELNSIWFYESEREALVPAASTDEATAVFDTIPVFEPGESVAWSVFESGEPQVYDDVRAAPDRYNDTTKIRSEMVLPLGESGVFIAGSRAADDFDDRQVSLAKLLATNVEVALERIDQRRDIQKRQAELQRQNERLDEFASVVSHDLRNPLSVAKGNLEFVRENTDSDDADRVAEALERMETLIEDLLDLARAGNDIEDTEAVSISEIADDCWSNVDTGGVALHVTTGATVRADRSRLAQLLENLFRNAIEHGGPGVAITVGDLPDGFYVADDGPGIPEADRESVFDAGYSTSDEGTGFGLSIVRKIAEAHGWAVTATESEDGGARFEFTDVRRAD
jgi:PAS domain S-box-containing protein